MSFTIVVLHVHLIFHTVSDMADELNQCSRRLQIIDESLQDLADQRRDLMALRKELLASLRVWAKDPEVLRETLQQQLPDLDSLDRK